VTPGSALQEHQEQDVPGQPPEPADGVGRYVYAVVDAGATLPDGLAGLDGAPLRTVLCGEVAAVVADVAVDRGPGRRKDLLAHSAVVDALAAEVVIVPVQFGAILADDDSVAEDFLRPNHDRFLAYLEALDGRTQLTLQATYHESAALAEVVAADPQIADLRRRTRELPEDAGYADRVRLGELVSRAMEHKREEDAAVLLDSVLPRVVDHVERPGSGVDHLLDVALLVDDDRVAELEEHLESLAEAVHERIRLRLMGPMAPYDFVGGD
jgi:hypothetical protein